MPSRREFLKLSTVSLGVAPFMKPPFNMIFGRQKTPFKSNRPPLAKRSFISKILDETIEKIKAEIVNPEIAWMFENCFPNTLDTTVRYSEKDGEPDTFVITGDIHAMWLRDSSAQVWPYLKFASQDPKLKKMIAGVINRQVKCVLIDPYANAFRFDKTDPGWQDDLTDMKPELHERKWEADSLCYVIRLAYGYWQETGDTSCFNDTWKQAMELIIKTFREQQGDKTKAPYKFQRVTETATDTLPLDGYGNPTRSCGLINSAFRPSDDACIYSFLIPSNMFAVVSLRQLGEIYSKALNDLNMSSVCNRFAAEVEKAVQQHALFEHLDYGQIYAYEVDGYGNQLFMDDANVPSLLALPYLGCVLKEDRTYLNTRQFVLGQDNPYFFKGNAGEGIGGPHVGLHMIWPLSIMMRAFTSYNDQEILQCLKTLKTTHDGTGFMHESFNQDDPKKFTRKWFAWANTLFGELIFTLWSEKPHILKETL